MYVTSRASSNVRRRDHSARRSAASCMSSTSACARDGGHKCAHRNDLSGQCRRGQTTRGESIGVGAQLRASQRGVARRRCLHTLLCSACTLVRMCTNALSQIARGLRAVRNLNLTTYSGSLQSGCVLEWV
eukprot:5916515-Pleurochrysis_carterae.AAC.4